jgi:hypothetical protein
MADLTSPRTPEAQARLQRSIHPICLPSQTRHIPLSPDLWVLTAPTPPRSPPLFFAHRANTSCVSSQTLTTLRNLTASLFGVGAGILGLESYPGFLFYIAFSLLTSALVYALRVRGAGVKTYFRGSMELWAGGLLEGLSGFVLTWTLFYGLVRA